MKKIIGLMLVLVVLTVSVAGCSQGNSADKNNDKNASSSNSTSDAPKKNADDKIVIAGIYKAGDQVWFIDEGAAAEKKAKEMGADEFIYIDAKMNPDTYLQAIDNVIAQKVDGVITCIPDQQLSQVTVNKLKEAGIPVIAADDALQDENGNKLAPWVGISAYKIGYSVGKWMAEYVVENDLHNDEETGVLFLTANTISSCVPRTEGQYNKFKELIPDFNEEKFFYGDYTGSTEEAFTVSSGIITANPAIKKWMVMVINDEGGIGAVRALEQAGLDKESCVVGLGAYLAVGEYEKEYSAMKAASYFSAADVGSSSAKFLMEYILNGTEMPMEYAVDAVIVTEDNYKEIMDEYK